MQCGPSVYVYYHCDQWKSRDSMRLVGVFDEETLKRTIIEDIQAKDVELDDRDEAEILSMDIRILDGLLVYGHLDTITLNQRS